MFTKPITVVVIAAIPEANTNEAIVGDPHRVLMHFQLYADTLN